MTPLAARADLVEDVRELAPVFRPVPTLEERLLLMNFTQEEIDRCFAEPAEFAARPRVA